MLLGLSIEKLTK